MTNQIQVSVHSQVFISRDYQVFAGLDVDKHSIAVTFCNHEGLLQEEAVARLRVIGAHQGGMLMGTPLVKAEQDRSIRVEDLTEVVMGGSRLRQAK